MVLRAYPSGLLVSEVAAQVASECADIAKGFQGPGRFARGDQLVRASLSVVSNIAEACGRGTVPDFRRMLLVARGSAQETLAQLHLIEGETPAQTSQVRSLRNRTAFVIKLINRLYANPPPDK
jgi:four helix bundle protein